MNELAVVIPSNEPLATVERYLPSICKAASGTISISIVLVDSFLQREVEDFCIQYEVNYIVTNKACRAVQLNRGAKHVTESNLFFLHLDSVLPKNYDLLILKSLEGGALGGCFRLGFQPSTRFLNFWAYFSRYHWRTARGGDQGLFVTRGAYNQVGGYKEWPLMEDVQICFDLKACGKFEILRTPITTSSRKYLKHGQVYLQAVFILLTVLFWLGVHPNRLHQIYNRFVAK